MRMYRNTLLLILGSALCHSLAVGQTRRGGVLYTLDNNPNNASIIALRVGSNGTITGDAVQTPTGGSGRSGVTGPGQPAVGSLFSSNSVVSGDDYLFAVNPGSNSVSMFMIDENTPLQPVLVGDPADTLGQFPVSLAYSSELATVCVLNGGAIAGVACFSVNATIGLIPLDTSVRGLGRGFNQTTPPVGPFSTASDISFNPSSSALIASVKGSPATTPVTAGNIYAWPVLQGNVSREAVVTSLPTVILDFSLTFMDNDFNLVITDPALGADFLNVNSNLTVSVNTPVNVTYQEAICWVTYDPSLNILLLTDTAQGNITVLSSIDGSIQNTIAYKGVGAIDSRVLAGYFYFVTQSGTVLGFRILGIGAGLEPRQVQTFSPRLPQATNATAQLPLIGLATWQPNSYNY